MSPIADSLYPHMMKHKNFSLIKKAMLIVYPVILLGCAVVFLFAEPLLVFWLGAEGSQVVLPLRLLIPVAVFSFPNYVLGYPTLGAMGLAKYANIAVVFGTAVYLLGALLLWFTVGINLVTLCPAHQRDGRQHSGLPAGGHCEKPEADGRQPHPPMTHCRGCRLFCLPA